MLAFLLFQLVADGDAAVADYLTLNGETVWWDVTLRREVLYWEFEESLDFLGDYELRDMGRG